MPTQPDRGDDSFEVDRHIDDQPVRDDIIEPDEIDSEPVEEPTMDEETGVLPTAEELPESQGVSPMDAERFTEDSKAGPRLSDEEAESWGMDEAGSELPESGEEPDVVRELGPVEPTDRP